MRWGDSWRLSPRPAFPDPSPLQIREISAELPLPFISPWNSRVKCEVPVQLTGDVDRDCGITERLVQLVVDEGWPVSEVAARFQVSWPTVKR